MLTSIFFSSYHLKSILFFADLLLVSFYLIFSFLEHKDFTEYFDILLYFLTAFSLFHVSLKIFPYFGQEHLFLGNPIYQGIASGIAVLIAFSRLSARVNTIDGILLAINGLGVFISSSKASYLGVVIFCLYMILLKRKKWIPFIIAFIMLTFIIPNPIKKMVVYSITKDPYSANRLDMWKMCVDIFKDHPVAGVGLDNFERVAPRYNFKQKKGPANYFKAPRMPHSDYFKLLAEMGTLGILALLFTLFFVLRKCLAEDRFDIIKVIILYILFQALFINLVFKSFFFFLLLFSIKALSEKRPKFRSISIQHKFVLTFLFLSLYTILYILPFWSDRLIVKSENRADIAEAIKLLNSAQYLNPLNHELAYRKAVIYFNLFKETSLIETFHSSLDNIKLVQRLNPYYYKAYLMEAELYSTLPAKQMKYANLEQEILEPLEAAQKVSPFYPFTRLLKAEVNLEFGNREKARAEAIAALDIEPQFVRALYFLHNNFNYIPDPAEFQKRIDDILNLSAQYQPNPGTYLFELFSLPSTNTPQ